MARKTIALLAAGIASLTLAAPAFAADAVERAVRVSYADLDLSKPAGVERLYSRLKGAADAVCGDANVLDLRTRNAVLACQETALDAAVVSIGHSAVTARHLGKTDPVKLAEIREIAPRS